jgi:hypothetical protein
MDALIKRPVIPAVSIGLLLVVLNTAVVTWKIIPPGYTGIRINRLVGRGISHEDTVTGFVLYNPVQTQIIVYPTRPEMLPACSHWVSGGMAWSATSRTCHAETSSLASNGSAMSGCRRVSANSDGQAYAA